MAKIITKQTLLKATPFLLAMLIMVPRLVSPQFGLLDDASTLQQAHHFLSGDFSMSHDMQAGRFRPVYWAFYTLLYLIAGYHPFWYFLGNLALLFVLLIEIRHLLRRSGAAEWQILLTSCVFILSMPIIQNFYTLSKGEPLQLVLIMGALIFATSPSAKGTSLWGKELITALLLLLAILVKETAIAILPLAIVWALFPTLTKNKDLKTQNRNYWGLVGAAFVAILSYFLLRQSFHNTALLSGTYTNRYLVDLGETINKLLRWMTQYAFYFNYTVPLIILWVWFVLKKVPVNSERKFDLFRWGTWWIAWFVIFIPWTYAEIYYLLAFALGGAMLIGLTAPIFLSALKTFKSSGRLFTLTLGILTGCLFLLALPNYRTEARTQLAFDRVNNDMLAYIINSAPENSTVLMNRQTTNEYSEKMDIYLKEHFQRADINFGIVNPTQMETIAHQSGVIVLMPYIEHQPILTVRAGIEEAYQGFWNVAYLETTDGKRQELAVFEDSFQLSNINLPVILCKFGLDAGFCQNPDPIFDFRTFTYRWEISQIQ